MTDMVGNKHLFASILWITKATILNSHRIFILTHYIAQNLKYYGIVLEWDHNRIVLITAILEL